MLLSFGDWTDWTEGAMPATSLRAHSTPTSLPRSARPHVRLLRGWPSRTSPTQARTVTAPSPCLHTHGRASFREFHTCCDRKVRLPTLRGEVFWACVPNYYRHTVPVYVCRLCVCVTSIKRQSAADALGSRPFSHSQGPPRAPLLSGPLHPRIKCKSKT